MSNTLVHKVHVGLTDEGKFLASSADSPYFCFEADTEEGAVKMAEEALNFFHGVEGRCEAVRPTTSPAKLTRVFPRRVAEVPVAA